jgi:hypothetical protein
MRKLKFPSWLKKLFRRKERQTLVAGSPHLFINTWWNYDPEEFVEQYTLAMMAVEKLYRKVHFSPRAISGVTRRGTRFSWDKDMISVKRISVGLIFKKYTCPHSLSSENPTDFLVSLCRIVDEQKGTWVDSI